MASLEASCAEDDEKEIQNDQMAFFGLSSGSRAEKAPMDRRHGDDRQDGRP